MRQYDVVAPPRRIGRPFLVVLQHERAGYHTTIAVAPLIRPLPARGSNLILTPIVPVLGVPMQLMIPELTHIAPAHVRGEAIDNLDAHAYAIMAALDHLFSAAG
ncbi:MAG: CcdB family protein [Hyphomonadaceae bacterium]|nr:CcdB family protein [Hyphomonadaceae bacterium]